MNDLTTAEHVEKHSDQIKAYPTLSDDQIKMINDAKELEDRVGNFLAGMTYQSAVKLDPRWLAEARTDLQKGFMSLVRSVAQPDSSLNPPPR